MVVQEFHKYLDNEISVTDFEKWIYSTSELEGIIGAENYQSLLEFNYNGKSVEVDIQNFIFKI